MLKILKTHQRDLFISAGLFVLYWITRLTHLTNLPIFTDEAIYIRWSQIGSFDAAWRFIPLTDGKPPLFHWFVMLALRIFSDPLFAARLVSTFSGFFNLIGIWILAYILFKKINLAHLSALIYVLSPFMTVYDRLAVVDSLLTSTGLASLIFAVLLIKHQRLDTALLLGAAIGTALLTKASGLIFLLLTPLTLLLQDLKAKKLLRTVIVWAGCLLLAAVIAESLYSILRLSQFFYRIGQKNYEFIIPLSEFFKHPFSMTWGNAKSLFRWQVGYLSPAVAFLVALSFHDRKFLREKFLLLSYYFLPFLAIASFNKIIFPRFLLSLTPFLIVLAAAGLDHLLSGTKQLPQKLILLCLFLFLPALTTVNLILTPKLAAIPQSDRDQYLDSWPAGWGINETVAYLKQQATQSPIYLGTQGTFGLMPYALEIYLYNNPNVEIHSFWPVTTIPQDVLDAAETKTTYFIYNELEDILKQENLQLVLEFAKGRADLEQRHMRLFKVNPK